jgi:hypothetical protein
METYKLELQAMDQRLTELEEKIDVIDVKLTQVVDAILGNPLTKAGGFIQDIEVMKTKISDLEKKQEKNDEFKKRFTWTVSLVVGIAIVIQYLLSIYSNLSK